MALKPIVLPMTDFFKNTFPIYTSNSFKNLSQKCIENIRAEPASSKTYLAYPSNEAKDYFIQSNLINHSHVFGIRFITIQQFIHLILKICSKKDLLFPSHYELMFFLEEKINLLLNLNEDFASPLKEYIEDKNDRITALSSNLSHIFLDYMLYGKDALPAWQKTPGWQQHLYAQVLTKWTSIIDTIKECKTPPFPLSLHIFAIDTIPALYLEFLEKLSPHISFSFYFFSPSPLFWGDLVSRKKTAYLDKLFQRETSSLDTRIELAEFSKKSHPLLSHFCEAGKPLYNFLQEKDPTEDFVDIEMNSDLTYIQKAILYQIEPSPPPYEDGTFLIHNAPSLLREVEVLLTNILQALKNHPGLRPSDITVLAPDIDLYYPFIAYHFAEKSLPFSYTVSNLQKTKHNACLDSLNQLFHLADSRFEKDDITKLFSSPFFRRRCQIGNEETEILKKIIDYTGIRWGFDNTSKSKTLNKEKSCPFGLFEKGFDLILDLLAEKDSSIEFSAAESIGDVISLVNSLYKDISDFKETKGPLNIWLAKTVHLAEKYLYVDESGEFFFKEIKKITSLAKVSTFNYSYTSFKRLLMEVFTKKGAIEKTYEKPPITFSSMESSPPVEKALFFLGLDAENFPRKDTLRSLNELQADPAYEKKQSPAKKARFYLLKAICSAKTLVSFSFTSNNPSDGRARGYSPIIEEMIAALLLKEPIIHPFTPYAPCYFKEPNVLEKNYHLYLSSKERKAPPFTFLQKDQIAPSEKTILYKDLSLLTKSPSGFFYNLSTKLYESRNLSTTLFDDSEFVLSYLDKAIFTKKRATEERPSFQDLINTNKLPTAVFGTAAKKELHSSISQEKQLLKENFSTHDPYFSLILDPHISGSFEKENNTFLPAITTFLKQTKYTIEGTIPNLTDKGILSFKKTAPGEIWKHLPCLILLANLNTSVPTSIFFIKEGLTRSFPKEKLRPLLFPLISYYEKALKNISPVVPEAVEEYIKDKTIVFAKLKTKLLSRFHDPYLERANPKDTSHFEEELLKLSSILEHTDESV